MTPFWVNLLLGLVGVLAGAIASIAGFGIGSLLTPLLALQTGTKLAVAAVAIPHVLGTALRFWILREHVDRRILLSFGIMSAAGGLMGALAHRFAENPVLTTVFGILLIFAGLTGITGLAERMRLGGWLAWVGGFVSGLLGGLVGNQGGIRSAAMLGFDVPKDAFVATATAVALIVDAARVPVYLVTQGYDIIQAWPFIAAGTAGVIAGTVMGAPLLRKAPEAIFRPVVSVIVLIVGGVVLFSAFI